MSHNYRDEKSYQTKQPILVESGSSEIEEASLTTADLANAGEHVRQEETRRTETEPIGESKPATNHGREDSAPLFSADEASQFRSRWDAIQVAFVDEPRRSVEQADQLVASTVKRLAQIFTDERARLEQQWSPGDQVSTEDLRVALQRYRSFFGRLLSV